MALAQSLLPVWLPAWVVQSSKYRVFAFFRKRGRTEKGDLVHSFPTELLGSHQPISVYFPVGEKWQQLWRKDWSKLHMFVNLWNLFGKQRNSSERTCLSAERTKNKKEFYRKQWKIGGTISFSSALFATTVFAGCCPPIPLIHHCCSNHP